MKIAICANTSWNLVNFRAGLIRHLIAEGHEVVALAPADTYSERVRALGCELIEISMDKHGTSPARDLLLCADFARKLRRSRPDVYLGYTVKPNIYGSIAARALNISVINNIAGLGVAFSKPSIVGRVVQVLYKIALKRARTVFFQNSEDRDIFVSQRLVSASQADVLPGSGVDLQKFVPRFAMGGGKDRGRFLLISRLLWEKGIGEFVEAARIVRRIYPDATFQLLGFHDSQSPSAVDKGTLETWIQEGVIQYLGPADDVRPHIADADCIVLPSYYREGTPRSLLEAAAMGKPIITTDSVGCRDVVDDGVTGFLCEPRNASDLAEKMLSLVVMTSDERQAMGRAGRLKAVREFDEKFIFKKYSEALRAIAVR